jgi:hypothetical protein
MDFDLADGFERMVQQGPGLLHRPGFFFWDNLNPVL